MSPRSIRALLPVTVLVLIALIPAIIAEETTPPTQAPPADSGLVEQTQRRLFQVVVAHFLPAGCVVGRTAGCFGLAAR